MTFAIAAGALSIVGRVADRKGVRGVIVTAKSDQT